MTTLQPQPESTYRSVGASPILAASGVRKTYHLGRVDVPVLRGASISVAEGEWVAILGASGSGKSTLLHILGGLDRADRPGQGGPIAQCPFCQYDLTGLTGDVCPECGRPMQPKAAQAAASSVQFRGRELADMSARELDRYRNTSVGFVFQFYHLLPELNVLENAMLPAMVLHGRFEFAWRTRGLRVHAKTLLESFGLGHRLNHRPAELSGGERQRVAIARALMNNPAVLLADEPTGNLDRKTGDAILDAIALQRERDGRTLVMVTHDQEVAARADRVVHLRDGRIVNGA